MHAKSEGRRGVVEILDALEARHECRSKGVETTELFMGTLEAKQQYDETTTRFKLNLSIDWMVLFVVLL